MSDIPRCKTCIHWEFREDPRVIPNDMHACGMMGHNGSYPEDNSSLAWAFSYEEADAVVFTHESFGCVMHRQAEET